MYLPFRISRNYWRIPLYCNHVCNDLCNELDEKCSIEKFYQAPIGVENINIMVNDVTAEGVLVASNQVVIPDTSFSVVFDSPFSSKIEVAVNLSTPPTLSFLLILIKDLFRQMYKIELETAQPTEHIYYAPCTSCDSEAQNKIDTLTITDKSGDCSICYDDLSSSTSVELSCAHVFHKHCLSQWIQKGAGKVWNCPLCRTVIFHCSECNDEKMIERTEHAVVLPRDISIIRTRSNGVYGIHTYHFQDLYIDALWFNRKNKLLQVIIDNHIF